MVFKKNSFLKQSVLLFSLSSELIFAEAKPVKEVAVVMVAEEIAQENPPLLGPIVLGLGCILGLWAFIKKIYKYECNRNEEINRISEETTKTIDELRESQHKRRESQNKLMENQRRVMESQHKLKEGQNKLASLIPKLEEFFEARRGRDSALNEPTS